MTVAGMPLGDGSAPPVGMGRRFAARALDLPLALLVGAVVAALTRADSIVARLAGFAVALLAVVIVGAYLAATGYLPGGRLLRVRQLRVVDGRPAGLAGIAKYAVVSVISALTLGIGYLVVIVLTTRDAQRRGWHDRLTGLIVVDARGTADHRTPTGAADAAGVGSQTWTPNSWEGAAWAPGAWNDGAGAVVARAPAGSVTPVTGVVPVRFQGPAVDPSLLPDPTVARPAGQVAPGLIDAPWATPPAPVAAAQPTPGGAPQGIPEILNTVAHQEFPQPFSDGGAIAELDLTVASLHGSGPVHPAHPARSHEVQLPGGQLLAVSGVVLLGRQPVAHADHPAATLIRLDDPARSISRTHLALGCG